ncbi:uncharacterized protein FOMMEDRAFT_132895 [Fomitiporia mediterranea MF3/22]|uniref:uncharacterized protein n=1 Tax=Fomitiporia mediterranea (strain MF3/22) TaxID=694068 RepID=UPI00044079B9|nr:uncharacterized protein FOMMEDRAFT_132895 [Fomitiporia mediterranea MF3/22]EJD05201.1 hypothetical protein FOMMEDRAFT_132895 [Fomitiporia mediterranea MF3/22]
MSLSLALTLLRKLLHVCRQWAGCALPLLLRLFSVIGRYLDPRRFSRDTGSTKKDGAPFEIDEGQISHCNGDKARRIQLFVSDNAAVYAYSSVPSMPATPPAARVHHTSRSMDTSIPFPGSSTNAPDDSTGPLSGVDRETYYDLPLEVVIANSFRESSVMEGVLPAEPVSVRISISKPLEPIAPSASPRYNRNTAIKYNGGPWVFKPLKTYDVYKNRDVCQWKYYIHPDGQPYYLLEKCGGQKLSYLTEADLQDDSIIEEIEAFMQEVESHAANFDWSRGIPENVEVVLKIDDDRWSYYMVDLDQRCVFWLDDYDMSTALGERCGVESLDHFRSQLDFEFWQHIEYFPDHRKICPDIFNEVTGILNYWRIEVMTSGDSTAPYDSDELDALVLSVNHLRSVYDSGGCAYAIAGVARIMGLTCNVQQLNFYGFNGARIPIERDGLIKFLSLLLFHAPEAYLSGLEEIWVDGAIRDYRWRKYQIKLENDRQKLTVTSTVLLAVNVSLLSSPIFVSKGDSTGLWKSPAAYASQISIVASVCSIFLSVLLAWHMHKYKASENVRICLTHTLLNLTIADLHFSQASHFFRGFEQARLERIAIQLSLPFALLIWAMIAFLASIILSCFIVVDGTPSLSEQMVYSVIWICTLFLLFWIWNNHSTAINT